MAAPYSSTAHAAVPSAKSGLTSVFGMGTGVPHSLELPRQELLKVPENFSQVLFLQIASHLIDEHKVSVPNPA